jgi:tetratricopeptide (TPR) repeat protein
MLDALEDLLVAGHADAVVALAERAHRSAEKAMQNIDDSDGWLGDISQRVADLHLRACEDAKPDAVELARRLVDLELTSELDTFHRAAARYADVLSAPGIAEYRRLVEPRWRAFSPRGDQFSMERFRLTEAMVGIALATGDPDALIAVKRMDLRTPDDYLEVAESLATAGRVDDSMEWARKGLGAFPDRFWQTPPLREFLAASLRGRGDSDGAVELFWTAFESVPTLDSYRRLLQEAESCGDVAEWRRRAQAALRARLAEARPEDDEARRSLIRRMPASSLVEILLYEGEADTAWQTASEYGCEARLWLTLARAREKAHPRDAIPVYEREMEAQIETKKNGGYKSAVDYLARIRTLSRKAGTPEVFEQLLASVRAAHKPKRNLMALLDQKGW